MVGNGKRVKSRCAVRGFSGCGWPWAVHESHADFTFRSSDDGGRDAVCTSSDGSFGPWLCSRIYNRRPAGVFLRFDHTFRPVGASPGQRKVHGQVSETLLHGQLVNRKGRVKFAVMRMMWGTHAGLAAVLKAQGFKTLIQTVFVERVNLTLRRNIAPLMCKTWAYAQTTAHLHLHVG